MSRHFTDAVISERLSSSSYIIDIYAHCAQSVVNEIGKSNLRKDIRDHNHKNSRSSRLIAQYALDLSHALADIHSVDSEGRQNPTIVYKDLKPDNVLVTEGSILKLSDFNDSELLRWNVTSNAPCFFRRKRYKANVSLYAPFPYFSFISHNNIFLSTALRKRFFFVCLHTKLMFMLLEGYYFIF